MANRLNVEMNLDLTPFEKALGRLQSRLSDLSRRMQQTGETLSQNLTLPILGVGAAAVKAFGDMERLENGLTAIMGSSEAAGAELERLRKVAEAPGLALPEVVKASASLQSVGFSANNARATIEQFGNAVARSAGNAETFDGVILALSQISAVGQVTQEDLNQIKERIPEFSRVMQQEFGVTTAEAIRELGISSDEFIERSVGALSKLERAKGGISNAFDNFKDNVTASLAVLGESIATNLNLEQVLTNLSNTLARIVNVFKNLSPAMQKTVVIFAAVLAGIGPLLFIVGKLAGAWGIMLTGFRSLISIGPKIAAAWTFITGPVGLTIAAIAGLIAILAILYTKFEGVRRVINGLGMAFIEIAKLAKESFTAILEGFSKLKEGDFKGAAQSFATGLKAFNPIEQGRVAALGFAKGFEDTTDYLTPAIEGIKKKVKEAQASFGLTTFTPTTPGGRPPGGGGTGAESITRTAPIAEFGALPTLNLLPTQLESVSAANERLAETNKAVADSFQKITPEVKSVSDYLTPLQNSLILGIEQFANLAQSGLTSMKELASAIRQSVGVIVGDMVKVFVAKALAGLPPSPFLLAAAPAIATLAGNLAKGLIGKIGLKAFADGGLVFGPTPALVGDNPGARTDPEVIAPLSKLKDYLNPAGGGFVAEARISGTDLLILVNNADRANKRVR
jgi:tape measure domain-containing protein